MFLPYEVVNATLAAQVSESLPLPTKIIITRSSPMADSGLKGAYKRCSKRLLHRYAVIAPLPDVMISPQSNPQ